ncbi:hypothetical protein [Methylobacterium ajmalii]|jgi:hypothetical protein|uniref:hypothetical protein n=1 Tax=Methylobacterium ajmalii TaxID=2738439 RepID=UPI00190D5743|nr:hypothetical protein [Methylobacterium ajmalii]MBK3397690.1 hypothetical protein [Methylobacterium ajmalii]MBK3411705.1 hypothetical protein [Methylobacterium ajmalii]MBK3425436.1 hypothetical protein [Methylobacterium ajmalii]MBZ6414804.1 hypothetical protein [Methylobacterium sp.]
MPEAERETRRRDRIVARIREGSYDEGGVEHLKILAAGMTDAEILRMDPFDGEGVKELGRRVFTYGTPVWDHWTRRAIPAGYGLNGFDSCVPKVEIKPQNHASAGTDFNLRFGLAAHCTAFSGERIKSVKAVALQGRGTSFSRRV